MKKTKWLGFFMMMFIMCLFVGCGGKDKLSIERDWVFESLDLNGQGLSASVLESLGGCPTFETDGERFTYTDNGKSHSGTIRQNGDIYVLDLDKSDTTTMEAVVSGDELTITMTNSAGTMILYFKAE